MDSEHQDLEKVDHMDGEKELIQDHKEIHVLEVKYAGFWMRFWAYLLDLLVIGSINGIVVYPIFRALDLSLNKANMFAPVSVVTALIFYAYFVLMTRFFGQTLGKMVFGFRVISLKDQKLSWGASFP